MQYWLEKKLTKANYMKLPELFQPVEKKGKWASPTCAESHPPYRQINALAKKLALHFSAG
jgi:hypothetical protein